MEPLTRILEGVVGAAKSVNRKTAPKVMVKVSPDEDQDEQIEGIVEAIWRSGVDGVIVGNTTKRRHNLIPQDVDLSPKERQILDEQGGFSGPHMFERTLGLVKRYRRLLDEGPPPPPKPEPKESPPPKAVAGPPSADEPGSTITEKIEAVKESLAGSQTQGAGSAEVGGSLVDGLTKSRDRQEQQHEQKVIFATGGITNGKQALEILNAGASVAQIYTALIYGGMGTVSRIKKEMREELARKG
jgi:dihydroorotate dehydrogenase